MLLFLIDNLLDNLNLLFNFLDDFTHNWFFNIFCDLLDSDIFNSHLHNILYFLHNLDDFLDFAINRYNNLNDPVDGNRYLHRHNGGFFNFDNFYSFRSLIRKHLTVPHNNMQSSAIISE